MEARVSAIAADMMTSDFLEKFSESTYKRYVRITRLFLKCPDVFEIVKTLNDSVNRSDKKVSVLGVSNLDDNVLFCASAEDFPVYLRAEFMHISRPEQTAAFSDGYFYGYALKALEYLMELDAQPDVKENCEKFQDFFETNIAKTKTLSITIQKNYINIVSLF